MVGSARSFIEHVGHVLFPRGPLDLTDPTRCPACFVALPPSSVCVQCGLDLNHPDASLLREDSLDAAALLESRLEIIGKIRFETAAERVRIASERQQAVQSAAAEARAQQAERALAALNIAPSDRDDTERHGHEAAAATDTTTDPAAWTPPAPVVAATTAAAAASPSTVADAVTPMPAALTAPEAALTAPAPAPAAASAIPAPAPAERTHAGIQVILLIVGVSLLSVGAIFFLIYAFISFGLIWRSAIIATVTIASIVGASLVKKRGLSATAEALSALAAVLITLDIYAVRENELLVIGDAAGRAYWGGAIIIASLAFMVWHRRSSLRVVSLLAHLAFAPGVALLAAGLADGNVSGAAVLLPMTALAAGSLIYLTARHENYRGAIERITGIVYAFSALTVGSITAVVTAVIPSSGQTAPEFGVWSALWLLVLGATGVAHAVAAHRAQIDPIVRNAFAAASGILVATGIWQVLSETVDANSAAASASPRVLVVVATLTVLAVLSESSGALWGAAARASTAWAAFGVWAVTAIALVAPLFVSLTDALQHVDGWTQRATTPGSIPFLLSDAGWSQLALLSVPAVLAIGWLATKQLRRRRSFVLAAAGLALTVSAPLAGTLFAAVITWLVLATAAAGFIAFGQRREVGVRASVLVIAAGGFLSLAFAYLSGWSSYDTWLIASVGSAIVLAGARYLVTHRATRATMLGAAAFSLLSAAAGFGEQLQLSLGVSRPAALESWLAVAILASAILARALWPRTREVNALELRMLWWIGFVTTAVAGSVLWLATLSGAPTSDAPLALDLTIVSFIVATVFVAALAATMLRLGIATGTAERFVAAGILAPSLVWALDSASRAVGLGSIALELAPATASVLVGALSMTLRVRQQHPRVRLVSELSALLVAAITTLGAIVQPLSTHWLIALLVSITLLLTSISADGIFGSRSLRRFAIWAAVAFGTWSLWLRLDQASVDALEAYLLPLAAAVLGIAFFTARAELRESLVRSSPYIALVGLLIAVIPLALNAAGGPVIDTIIIAALSAALLIAAAYTTPRAGLLGFWGIAIIAATAGIVTATASRTLYSVDAGAATLATGEPLVLMAFGIIAIASWGVARRGFSSGALGTRWAKTGPLLLSTGLVLLFITEIIVVVTVVGASAAANDIRVIALVTFGAALSVVNARFDSAPLTRAVSYVALTLAAALALAAYALGVNSPLELAVTASIIGIGVIARSLLLLSGELPPRETPTLWWTGFSLLVIAAATLWPAAVSAPSASVNAFSLDVTVINAIVSLAVVAALGFTMFARGAADRRVVATAAAAVLAPAVAWLLDSVVRLSAAPAVVLELSPATAAVLVGALSMVLRLRGHQASVRRASEISALAVGAITITATVMAVSPTQWLIPLLLSIALLFSSITRDGVFGSRSQRRHIIWAAVAFATWALWQRLDQSRVEALEAYVLPLAALVVVLGIFIARAELRETRLSSAPAITLAGLLIAILPLSLNAASGEGLRTLVIAGLCGALLLAAAFVEPPRPLVDFWGVAAIAAAIGLVTATASRAIVLIVESRSALPELDSWLLGAVAILALASFGAAASVLSRSDDRPRWSVLSEVLLGSAIVLLYGIETLALLDAGYRDAPLDTIRVIALVALGGTLLVLTARASTRPLTHRMSYLAFGLASMVGALAFFANVVQPIEWVTTILGVALLAYGGIRMSRDAQARSMRWLSPGLIITLVPSLIATFVDSADADTAWRIVVLGIVSVVMIVVGTWLKLKAPLLIATIVVLIHAIHTFAPAIVSLYQLTSWWLWAVIGGAIVLFLGITLERRIRDFKTLNTKFSELR
ncbi:hypothetical protein ESZ53_04240 [Salinibacterium sp. UTAS2018]|uniref:SCO7613 C-terminal domain-containing membrane protein n=1 Tax=Salinibacterium sp. UTAS2018 TaxID=2508880 RepID=UPI0010094956|nr:hypothetical protein [Salinibacterium sp. UTAS2018]QAV69716.1 hypothetical protein ESZ53_04240 [Salinibacterium sp. UTAS2018]